MTGSQTGGLKNDACAILKFQTRQLSGSVVAEDITVVANGAATESCRASRRGGGHRGGCGGVRRFGDITKKGIFGGHILTGPFFNKKTWMG